MKLHLSQLTGLIATFDARIERGPGVQTFRFSQSGGAKWEAGQYYVYFLPGALADKRTALRPFTVSSMPAEGYLEFTTRVPEKPSLFKQQAMQLQPGAKVYAAGPFGFFTFRPTERRSVFLAGGIGITAFRSMLIDLATRGPMPEITLLYANRDEHILYKDELDTLATQQPKFMVHYLTNPERLDAASIRKYVPEIVTANVYVSGPKPMVAGLTSALADELKVPSGQIFSDSFKGYPWPLKS